MKVAVHFFATLRDLTGVRQQEVTMSEGATIAQLLDQLAQQHSRMGEALETAVISVNREYAFPDETLNDGDEVAIFPPVSGGSEVSGPTIFRVTEDPLNLDDLLTELILPETGAACVFAGFVRAHTERGDPRDTSYLEYESYPEMAESKMRQTADEIRQRWPMVQGIAIVQRVGRLDPGTQTVMIACTSAHRDTGVFEAARYGIDRVKQIVPIWKKEVGPDGETWVEGDYVPAQGDRNP